jgi:hypothetical protein
VSEERRKAKLSTDAALLLACMRELSYTWRQSRSSATAQDLAHHLDDVLDRYEAGEFKKLATKENLESLWNFYQKVRSEVKA